jgi:hypothetical protein
MTRIKTENSPRNIRRGAVIDTGPWTVDHRRWTVQAQPRLLSVRSATDHCPSSTVHRPSSIVHRPYSVIHYFQLILILLPSIYYLLFSLRLSIHLFPTAYHTPEPIYMPLSIVYSGTFSPGFNFLKNRSQGKTIISFFNNFSSPRYNKMHRLDG